MTRETSFPINNKAQVGLLSVKINLPGCSSLKEKRSRLQPMLLRLRKYFNAGIAETALHDLHQSSWMSCVIVSTEWRYIQLTCEEIIRYIKTHFPDEIIEERCLEQR